MNAKWQYYFYKNVWNGLDWLFPPNCGGCGTPGTRWCTECQKKVRGIKNPSCDACGLPLIQGGICDRCQKDRPEFKQLRSWVVFENPVQTALHRLKYRRDIGLGEALANQMIEFVENLAWPVDMLIPIPLGEQRLKERGYNQVAMVAMPLSVQLRLEYFPNALVRARETKSQVGLSAKARQENVRNAFLARDKIVAKRRILLIDDVSTTGATLSSAADALYASGARDVYAITIARALPHHGLSVV